MTDLIDTTEMYLRTIYELEEEGIVPLRARIAERLRHSGPTVSQTIARMERDGLLSLAGDRHLELSQEGRLAATRVMRKHRLAERLLVDVIGLDWGYVHDEACRWEHVMSDRVEERILTLIDDPRLSPYGNPIPGLQELGLQPAPEEPGLQHLVALAGRDPRTVLVNRIGEPGQVDHETLAMLTAAGLRPGRSVQVRVEDDRVLVIPDGGDASQAVSVPQEIASHVFATTG